MSTGLSHVLAQSRNVPFLEPDKMAVSLSWEDAAPSLDRLLARPSPSPLACDQPGAPNEGHDQPQVRNHDPIADRPCQARTKIPHRRHDPRKKAVKPRNYHSSPLYAGRRRTDNQRAVQGRACFRAAERGDT